MAQQLQKSSCSFSHTTLVSSPKVAQPVGGTGRFKGNGTVNSSQSKVSGSKPQSSVGISQSRVFALTTQDAQTSNTVVSGILPICSINAHVLFDIGSTHSFIFPLFASCLGKDHSCLEQSLMVSTPLKEAFIAKYEYKSCVVRIKDKDTLVDLVLLDMLDFDVILGINWLSPCYASVDCHNKLVRFDFPREPSFCIQGDRNITPTNLISAVTAKRMLNKGCHGYLAVVKDTQANVGSLDQIPIVREFSNVFLEELPGLSLEREIEFCIDLIPNINPISIPLYRMLPLKLKELKNQLEDLLDKGFFRPNVSPWGAPVLS
ncbi:hypothetical protein CRYUN_Cryun11dG0026700 [Craigia yunnanensis]